MLNAEMKKKIKEEILNDPMGMMYKGKTSTEVAILLCEPVRRPRMIYDTFPSRINQILIGVANTPNIVSDTDITEAMGV